LTTSGSGPRQRRTKPAAAALSRAGADATQLGAQLLGPQVLALLDLQGGQRVDQGLPVLLPGLGRAQLARHLQRCRDELGLAGDV
jgi:hypothetical protein